MNIENIYREEPGKDTRYTHSSARSRPVQIGKGTTSVVP